MRLVGTRQRGSAIARLRPCVVCSEGDRLDVDLVDDHEMAVRRNPESTRIEAATMVIPTVTKPTVTRPPATVARCALRR